MNRPYTFNIFLLFLLLFNHAYSQQAPPVTPSLSQAENNIIANYNTAIGPQSRLYIGYKYYDYPADVKGSANFKDTTVMDTKGSVTYDNILYTNVPLLYDQNRGEVVSLLNNGVFKFSLLSARVQSFTIYHHHFVNVEPDSLNKDFKPGFYDEIYQNKIQVLVRTIKSIQIIPTLQAPQKVFLKDVNYYLKKDGKYYSVNSKGGFLSVLKDRKQELKMYIKKNQIDFSDNKENAMAMVAAYYDTLTN